MNEEQMILLEALEEEGIDVDALFECYLDALLEEIEQVDEISTETKKSYVKNALTNLEQLNRSKDRDLSTLIKSSPQEFGSSTKVPDKNINKPHLLSRIAKAKEKINKRTNTVSKVANQISKAVNSPYLVATATGDHYQNVANRLADIRQIHNKIKTEKDPVKKSHLSDDKDYFTYMIKRTLANKKEAKDSIYKNINA
jgi:hypothetical protein